jgi:hypothetical protein
MNPADAPAAAAAAVPAVESEWDRVSPPPAEAAGVVLVTRTGSHAPPKATNISTRVRARRHDPEFSRKRKQHYNEFKMAQVCAWAYARDV